MGARYPSYATELIHALDNFRVMEIKFSNERFGADRDLQYVILYCRNFNFLIDHLLLFDVTMILFWSIRNGFAQLIINIIAQII